MYSALGLVLGAGFWQESVSQDNVWLGDQFGKETLTLRLIPVILMARFYPPQRFLSVQPYTGAGMGVNFIEKTVLREKSDQKNKDHDSGLDYLWLFSAGVEKKLLPNLLADLQVRYVLGSYVQEVEEIQNEVVDKNVSMNGL
jgi:outer membrane protein W